MTRIAIAVLLVALRAAPGLALPKGYEEDFAGCRDRSRSAEDRERCCKETHDDCIAQCSRETDAGASPEQKEAIARCEAECTRALTDCTRGPTSDAPE